MGVPDAFPNIVKIVKNFTRVRDSRLLPNVPIFGRKLLLGKRRENAEHHSLTMRNNLSISNWSWRWKKKQLWPNWVHFQKNYAPIGSVFKNCKFDQIKYILRGGWMTLKRKRGPELTLGWLIRKSHQNAPIRFPSLFPPAGKYLLTTQRTISHGEVTNFLKVTQESK